MKREIEIKYYGLHACLSLWEKRPQDVVRVYLEESNLGVLKHLLKWCAQNKKAYHIVPAEDMARICESIHHEGVCVLAKEPAPLSVEDFLAFMTKAPKKTCLIYLDGVQNPHNLGSILRTCAHFAIPFVLGEQGKLPSLSASACRIAKGGAEMVQLVSLPNPMQTLKALQKLGFVFIGTSSHKGSSLYRFNFPEKAILAIGSESHGISKEFLSLSSTHIQIPGSGLVESLNVSVATSLCIGEYSRQHPRQHIEQSAG